jgi:hypothetical protein
LIILHCGGESRRRGRHVIVDGDGHRDHIGDWNYPRDPQMFEYFLES